MSEQATATAKGATEIVEPTRAQQQLARRVAESRATIPDLTLAVEVDVEDALAAGAGVRESVVYAVATALREHPEINAAYRDARFERYARVNVGVVLADGRTPTIFDADTKSASAIAAELSDLEAAELAAPQMAGATCTVLVLDGVRRVVPPVQQPQAAVIGVGAATPRALAIGGAVSVRRAVDVTLVCDHRIVHGTAAAAFLSRVAALLATAPASA